MNILISALRTTRCQHPPPPVSAPCIWNTKTSAFRDQGCECCRCIKSSQWAQALEVVVNVLPLQKCPFLWHILMSKMHYRVHLPLLLMPNQMSKRHILKSTTLKHHSLIHNLIHCGVYVLKLQLNYLSLSDRFGVEMSLMLSWLIGIWD